MAAVDAYALCPCGSGQKFKWCCQKMESYADRAQRLYETGQIESALETLNEGLKKEPANAWLLIRKAVIQIREEQSEEAKVTLRELLDGQPQHVGGQALLVRCVLETEGPLEGIRQLQLALSTVTEAERKGLAGMLGITGSLLAQLGHYASALAHLRLTRKLTTVASELERIQSAENGVMSNPGVSPWAKNVYSLALTPSNVGPDVAKGFADALSWAEAGLWQSAAAAFELLLPDVPGPEAERNLGLCRLWLAEDAPAAHYLRQAVKKMGVTDESVDLEALCQTICPPRSDEKVEHLQLIWPLRNRDALLAALKSSPEVVEDDPGPIDPTDPESPEVDRYMLLDRKPLAENESGKSLKPSDMPKIQGRVAVGREIATLDAFDDGTLDLLRDRFMTLAGPAIPPAHPKTKVLGTSARYHLAMSWEWYPPEGLDRIEMRRLTQEQEARLVREVWPTLKAPYLGGRTPKQAAEAGDAIVAMRAAACHFEYEQDLSTSPVDMAALRARLKISAEPELDPATVNIETLPYSRLRYVPVERLSDDVLLSYFFKARESSLPSAIERAALALAARPEFIGPRGAAYAVYTALANFAAARSDFDDAFKQLDEGRKVDPQSHRGANAPAWDMYEVNIRAQHQPPEKWVPELAIVLERYRDNPQSSQLLLMSMMQMGLVRMVPNPDVPGDVMLDPRTLQSLLSQYGPRVTTSTGTLGVSATKGEIWTPDSEAGGTSSGGIWTPGSGKPPSSGAGPDKPKLIIPGR